MNKKKKPKGKKQKCKGGGVNMEAEIDAMHTQAKDYLDLQKLEKQIIFTYSSKGSAALPTL
jgi:hypothetical protein